MSAGGCSGAMVSPYHFLTAGHCVHPGNGGNWYSNFQVTLGEDGPTVRPQGIANWTYARSYTGWTNSGDVNHDWALLTLDRRVGNTTGWLGYEVRPTSWFSGGVVNSAGYPGDLPASPISARGTQMYHITGATHHATEYRVFYNGTLDAMPGQSGSAMWRFDGTNRYVNSIVHWQYSDYNASVRINNDKFSRLGTWISEDNVQRPPTDRADLVDYDDWFSTDFASFSPGTVQPGQSFYKRAVVRNNGTAAAGSFRVSFYASTDTTINTSDYALGFTTISSLGAFNWADAINTSTFPNIPAGQYYFGWIIDSLGQVAEFSETNNIAYKASSRINVLPAAPSFLNATAISTSQINLSWQNVNGESGYRIERSPNGSSGWVQIATVGANVTSYANTGLASGTQYYYRVRAYHVSTGNGAYSPVDSATTYVAAPSFLNATAASSSRINLAWQNINLYFPQLSNKPI